MSDKLSEFSLVRKNDTTGSVDWIDSECMHVCEIQQEPKTTL